MSDLDQIDKSDPAAWAALSDKLLQEAVAAIQAADKKILSELQAEMLEVVREATLACPPEVLTAINNAARQVAAALLALDVTDLATRSAKLDAAGAKVNVAAATVRVEAGRLRLEAVRNLLGELNGVAQEVRDFKDQLDATAKKDLPAKIDVVLSLLQQFDVKFRDAVT